MKKHDVLSSVYEDITNKIIHSIDADGCLPWHKPWGAGQVLVLPENGHSGRAYSGVNILLLWLEQLGNGYSSNKWLTFNQAQDLGGSVRKGERSTKILFAGPTLSTKQETDAETGELVEVERRYTAIKVFNVFNACQIDGLPAEFYAGEAPQPINPDERNARLDEFIAATGGADY